MRSITDDTDDYAEINDVVDELEHLQPDLKVKVINERRISRSKIFDLERELEGQQDYHRATDIAKDRQLKTCQREIEGVLFFLFIMANDQYLDVNSTVY